MLTKPDGSLYIKRLTPCWLLLFGMAYGPWAYAHPDSAIKDSHQSPGLTLSQGNWQGLLTTEAGRNYPLKVHVSREQGDDETNGEAECWGETVDLGLGIGMGASDCRQGYRIIMFNTAFLPGPGALYKSKWVALNNQGLRVRFMRQSDDMQCWLALAQQGGYQGTCRVISKTHKNIGQFNDAADTSPVRRLTLSPP